MDTIEHRIDGHPDVIRHDKPGDVTAMPSPRRIGHLSILTNRNFEAMCEWYCAFFNAKMVNEVKGRLFFPTFDREHHRFAIIKTDLPEKTGDTTVGLSHAAFSYASLAECLFVYKRMKGLGVTPAYCVNHGTTTSFYYRDPDNNEMEIFVDNFDTLEEVVDYKLTTQFKKEAGFGEMSEGNFDPDKMVALFESGVPDTVLRDRREVLKLVKEGKL
jgi:catechol-2,3-dioxygenase